MSERNKSVVESKKRCTRCGQWKSLSCFTMRKSGKRAGERLPYCKPCNSSYVAQQHKADPKAAQAAQKRWRDANPEKAQAQWARARTKRLERNPNYWRELHMRYRTTRLVSLRWQYLQRRNAHGAALVQMIQKVLPGGCYGDVREELVSTLALAVLSKEIPITQLAEGAREIFRQMNRTSLSNRFKFRSLDAPISFEDATPLAERLVG
jgi:hypothetical protein